MRLQIYDLLQKNKKMLIFATFEALINTLIIQFMAQLSNFYIKYLNTIVCTNYYDYA